MRETVSKTRRDPLDFYRTPTSAVELILPYLPLGGRILEPAAGDGAIVLALQAAGVPAERIHAIELEPGRAAITAELCPTEIADFRYWKAPSRYDLVLGNPPYKHAQQFIEKSLECGETVAMLLRLGFLESQKRAPFHRKNPADVFVFAKRPCFRGKGQTYPAPFAWFVWGPGRGNQWSIL